MTTPGVKNLQELADSEDGEVDCQGGRLRNLSQRSASRLAEASWK